MLKQTTTPFLSIERPPSPFAQIVVGATGLGYTLVALALFFTPRWFLENIGQYPPFNRHYMGDLAAFLFPLGVGLLLAARNPARHHALIVVVAAGSVLHVLNHAFDGVTQSFTVTHWLTDTAPLIIAALLLFAALRNVTQKK